MEWNYTPKCLIISIRDVGIQSGNGAPQGSTRAILVPNQPQLLANSGAREEDGVFGGGVEKDTACGCSGFRAILIPQ